MPLLLVMLACASTLMTFAAFAHLRYPHWPLWQAVLVSWLIAGAEYAVLIPAIRIASGRGIDPTTIKIVQESVALVVFAAVIGLILARTGLGWRFFAASALVVAATVLVAAGPDRQAAVASDGRPDRTGRT